MSAGHDFRAHEAGVPSPDDDGAVYSTVVFDLRTQSSGARDQNGTGGWLVRKVILIY